MQCAGDDGYDRGVDGRDRGETRERDPTPRAGRRSRHPGTGRLPGPTPVRRPPPSPGCHRCGRPSDAADRPGHLGPPRDVVVPDAGYGAEEARLRAFHGPRRRPGRRLETRRRVGLRPRVDGRDLGSGRGGGARAGRGAEHTGRRARLHRRQPRHNPPEGGDPAADGSAGIHNHPVGPCLAAYRRPLRSRGNSARRARRWALLVPIDPDGNPTGRDDPALRRSHVAGLQPHAAGDQRDSRVDRDQQQRSPRAGPTGVAAAVDQLEITTAPARYPRPRPHPNPARPGRARPERGSRAGRAGTSTLLTVPGTGSAGNTGHARAWHRRRESPWENGA